MTIRGTPQTCAFHSSRPRPTPPARVKVIGGVHQVGEGSPESVKPPHHAKGAAEDGTPFARTHRSWATASVCRAFPLRIRGPQPVVQPCGSLACVMTGAQSTEEVKSSWPRENSSAARRLNIEAAQSAASARRCGVRDARQAQAGLWTAAYMGLTNIEPPPLPSTRTLPICGGSLMMSFTHTDYCQQRCYSRNRHMCRRCTKPLESCGDPKSVMLLAAGAATQRPRTDAARSGRCSTDSGKWSSICTSTFTRRTTSSSRVRSRSSDPSPKIGC